MTTMLTTGYAIPATIENFLNTLPGKALDLGVRIIMAIIFFLIGVQVIKLLRKIVRKSMERANAEVGVMQFVDSFLKAAMYVVLVFMLAASFGVDAASIVALLGSAGVAIGLAVQGSLSNLAGGVLILLLKPFKVGDYIMESTTGKEGTVTEIQIFYTKLATADNKVIILPNGNLANNTITNCSMALDRRIDLIVGISYHSDIRKAKKVLQEVIDTDSQTLKDKDRIVFVDALAESGVNLGIRCWCKNENYWDCKWRIAENCKYALDNAGIEIPYPQMDVHMKLK